MEVHHHPHSEGKRFKHYLFEFFMLFLAVFCGFWAENWREQIIEHHREKQYMVSLVRDVEMDIQSLKEASATRKTYITYFDSLVLLLKQKNKKSMNDIYFYARFLFRTTQFNYHDRTISQLKSSGGLRLIRSKQVADSITIYDNEIVKRMLFQQEFEQQLRNEMLANHAGKIFNAYVWNEMVNENAEISKPAGYPDLITDNSTLINDFILQVVSLKTTYRVTNNFIEKSIHSAENLIAFLKKEYQLN